MGWGGTRSRRCFYLTLRSVTTYYLRKMCTFPRSTNLILSPSTASTSVPYQFGRTETTSTLLRPHRHLVVGMTTNACAPGGPRDVPEGTMGRHPTC